MDFPQAYQYTPEHEWIDAEGRVGITDFAQEQLGDVVFVELPAVGSPVRRGEAFGVVESVKSVSDLLSPVDGEVEEVNAELATHPERVNSDPHGAGWMVRIRVTGGRDHLLDAAAYRRLIETE